MQHEQEKLRNDLERMRHEAQGDWLDI